MRIRVALSRAHSSTFQNVYDVQLYGKLEGRRLVTAIRCYTILVTERALNIVSRGISLLLKRVYAGG